MNAEVERPKSVTIIAGWLIGLSVILLLISIIILPIAFLPEPTYTSPTIDNQMQPIHYPDSYDRERMFRPYLAFAVPYGIMGLTAGIGMFLAKEWGRILCIVHCVVLLFAIPVGPIIGITCVIYLGKANVQDYFQGKLPSCQKTGQDSG